MNRIRSWFRGVVVRGTLQTALMSAALTLMLMNWGLTARKSFVRNQIRQVEARLVELAGIKALPREDLQNFRNLLRPVKYPLRSENWWLEYAGIVGSCLMIVAVCLMSGQKRLKARADDEAHRGAE